MLAEYLQHIRQQRHAGAEENEPDNVERLRILFAIVRQMQINQKQAGNSDWKIHKKYKSPLQVSDDKTAGDRPKHWADQTWNGDEAHGADELGFVERPHQGEPADRDHHGSAAALQDATGNQQMDVARYAAE